MRIDDLAAALARRALDAHDDPSKAHAYLMGMFDALMALDEEAGNNATHEHREVILAASNHVLAEPARR